MTILLPVLSGVEQFDCLSYFSDFNAWRFFLPCTKGMEALFAWSVDEYQTDMLYRHSSSSAIFERDVEPSPSHPLSPHPHITNPHRTPRSKITEALDQSVPTVLDSAAALQNTTDKHHK